MQHETVTLDTTHGDMDLHVYYPNVTPESSSIPAIIILQEAFGVNENIRNICIQFANKGYLAVAPELFHRTGKNIEIAYDQFPKVLSILGTLTNEQLHEDVNVTFDYLKKIEKLKIASIGSIGFCMGGFTSILAACRLPLDYAISCYGGGISNARIGIGFTPITKEFDQIACPVFLLYGEKDHSIPPEQIEDVRACLKKAEKEYEIKVYLGAGHAFLREGQPVHHTTAAPEAWLDIFSWIAPLKGC